MQIEQETRRFSQICQLTSLCIYGGVPKYEQTRVLRQGVDILIATPGRLLDFLDSNDTNLRRVSYLTLDEADRMLDMGFEKDIRRILNYIKHPDRQTLMFSATWPKEIQALARTYCSMAPIHIQIGEQSNLEGGLTVNTDIKQFVYVLRNNYDKYERLAALMGQFTDMGRMQRKIIIFCETKVGVNELENQMRNDQNLQERFRCQVRGIHGDKMQYQRDEIYRKFKESLEESFFHGQRIENGQVMHVKYMCSNILIATDVASRGLDVKDVQIVINYDMPKNIEDYVHRIGRTGRAGKQGESHSFITGKNMCVVGELTKLLRKSKQEVPPELLEMRGAPGGGRGNNRFRSWRQPNEFEQNKRYSFNQPSFNSNSTYSTPWRAPQFEANNGPRPDMVRKPEYFQAKTVEDNYLTFDQYSKYSQPGAVARQDDYNKRDNKYMDKQRTGDMRSDLLGNGAYSTYKQPVDNARFSNPA
mmetsp:Transcript_997/g.1790  ORF Transcript_997/g.1790 Transcript_997/m.1790 type:complete len:473 (+) Transcript_997:669-2087(+)